jgi:hypothetical protein
MKLIPASINKIKKHESPLDIFKQFLELNIPCAELLEHKYKNNKVAQNSLISARNKLNMYNISVCLRGNKIYLVNNLLFEKESR